jgi:hypothetical protein
MDLGSGATNPNHYFVGITNNGSEFSTFLLDGNQPNNFNVEGSGNLQDGF